MGTKTPIPPKESKKEEKNRKIEKKVENIKKTEKAKKIENKANKEPSQFMKTILPIWDKTMYFVWNVFFALPFMRFIGAILYDLGFQGEYRIYLIWRFIRNIGRFFKNVIWKRWSILITHIKNALSTIWHELFKPFYVFFRGIYRVAKHGNEVGKEKGFAKGIWASVCYVGRGLKLYVKVLPAMVSYVLPFIAFGFLWTVVQQSINQEFTLAVQVNGVTVGNVANEQIFESAKSDVQERVDYTGADASASFNISPTYVLSTETQVMTQTQMANAIIETSKEEIDEGTALYVDGELRAVTAGGEELKAYFTELKAPYEDPNDPNLTVRFNKEIEFVDGLYFTDSFTDYQEVTEEMSGLEQAEVLYTVVTGDSWSMIATKNNLTQAEIFNMNPGISVETAIFPGDQFIVATEQSVLEVLIVRQEEYDEVIPYQTEKTESDEYAFGVVEVIQEGSDGLRHVTAEVIYDTNGNAISTEILSNPVVVEPINRIEVIGTRLESGMVAQVGNGTFMWPVPGYTYVSRWAFPGHNGVDLPAPSGTPILASDAGVVIKAGWNGAGSGFGNSLIIDHGNGYQTLYAHAVALYVGVGDVVAQGQVIAGVGTTGYSTGNHLHFEVRRNGVLIYPQDIFGYGW